MRERWQNLTTREKQAVVVGGFFIALFIFYKILWEPLTGSVTQLRTRLAKKQTLYAWMQTTDQEIQKLSTDQQQKKNFSSPISLLSYVQKELNQQSLKANVTEIKQGANETIEIHFRQAEFDKIASWLLSLMHQHSIKVVQMNATTSTTPGLVDAEVALKAAS